jgi:serine phosphatase RsbU (regulator of sigma subunit)
MTDLPPRISEWLLQLVRSQREVAFLLVDDAEVLRQAGGELEHYGLDGLRAGESASQQVPLLEGLLPLPESPFLLRSVGMPSGRVADIHFFTGDDATWVVLLDATEEHDEAQKVQQKAYDMTLLSQREARLIAKLEKAHKELTEAHRELGESREALLVTHNRLQQELRDAEHYVRAVLPEPMDEPFAVDWRFIPSTELGGDFLGYHWLDDDHFALYLLDVVGHGVGAALLSVAASNTLRSGALPDTDFRAPEEVLSALNQAYQMEDHNDMYFTIWYGVYEPASGRLRYASAGHPAPILVTGPAERRGEALALTSKGPVLGIMPTARFQGEDRIVTPPARLFLFSDGAYEVSRQDGTMLDFAEFQATLAGGEVDGRSEMEEVLQLARETRGEDVLEDDFSILKMTV